MKLKSFFVLGLVITFFGIFTAQTAFASAEDKSVFVVFEDDVNILTESKATIQSVGGSTTVSLPPQVVIGTVPSSRIADLRSKKGVEAVYSESIDLKQFDLDSELYLFGAAWNEMQQPAFQSRSAQPVQVGDIDNGILIPDSSEHFSSRSIPEAKSAPYGAGYYDTSEVMIGSVSVGMFLTESDGSLDPNTENWSSGEESTVIAETVAALNWWVARSAQYIHTPLSFVLNVYTGRTDVRARTQYEPINRSGDGLIDLWGPEILANFGYTTNDGGANKFYTRAYQFINDMRNNDGTDWGFLAYVAQDSADTNGMFTDGTFAFALLGGPATQLTYKNDGWGPTNFDSVFAHEMGHIFYANDEYFSAVRDCTEKTGYYYTENQNSEYNSKGGSCAINEDSLMRSTLSAYQSGSIDVYAREQIGWRDSDGDAYSDIVDHKPILSISSNNSASNFSPTISGSISVGLETNQNKYGSGATHGVFGLPINSINVDDITSITYSIDGGSSQALSFTNSGSIGFSIQPGQLTRGSHTLQFSVQTKYTNGTHVLNYVFDVGAVQRLIVTGSGIDRSPYVRTFGYLGDKRTEFLAYSDSYKGGIEVATGDLDGDGIDEIITGTMEGGPQVRVFDQQGNPKLTNGFFAYSKNFRGGVRVAAGDLDGDGKDEIIAGAGDGGGPQVRTFDYKGDPVFTPGFFAYGENFRGGVYVASGDLNGDGKDEIITGAGNGGGPQVRVFTRYGEPTVTNGFFAYGENFRGGVLVDSYDLDGDGVAEILAGSGFTGGPQVRTFRGDGSLIFTPGFFAYNDSFRGGVFVKGYDLNADNKGEIITGTGYSGGPHIRIFTRYGVPYLTPGFFSEDSGSRSGAVVSAGLF